MGVPYRRRLFCELLWRRAQAQDHLERAFTNGELLAGLGVDDFGFRSFVYGIEGFEVGDPVRLE